MIKILVVEDDAGLNFTLCSFLRKNGYEVTGCSLANDAYNAMYNTFFDLIISDIMMPQIDGFEFAQTVRKVNQTIPIIFMTARDDFASKQKGFAAGIDDYLVKPVDLDELLLRISAILRRANIAQSKKLTVGSLTLDADAVTATNCVEGGASAEIPLTAREFNLTYKLLSYPNKTFTRVQLMDEFWDADSNATPRAVDVYITKLREKLSECSGFEIVTVHGLGYKAVIR
ncbi:MAG: response regulator transcription factor [Treponema sp.]|nr:response regulator transcription factor [Treponema sp.]